MCCIAQGTRQVGLVLRVPLACNVAKSFASRFQINFTNVHKPLRRKMFHCKMVQILNILTEMAQIFLKVMQENVLLEIGGDH
jgi:hypothetical protein